MKKLWIYVIAPISVGLIVDPALTMAIVTTIIFGALTFLPLLARWAWGWPSSLCSGPIWPFPCPALAISYCGCQASRR